MMMQHLCQILEAIMDIMQVLQDICKNPEDHDKGLSITHLTPLFHVMIFEFFSSANSFCNLFSVQSICVSTSCPPCSVLPEHLGVTATRMSRYCPSCSLDRLLLCCQPPRKPMRYTDVPLMTSAPSCPALCSRCVRQTLWGVKPLLCPACPNRYRW